MNGQLCNDKNGLVTSNIIFKQKSWKKVICNWISLLITWIGIVVVALLALPIGILALIVITVWTLTDRVASWIKRKGEN